MPVDRLRGPAVVGALLAAILSSCSPAALGGTPTATAQRPTPTGSPSESASPAPQGSNLSALSVTFVSAQDGWVLATRACGAARCLALLRTVDSGRTWVPLPSPPMPIAAGPYQGDGVTNVRFANGRDGWAFEPALWSTHDGGTTWRHVTLPSVPPDSPVLALETSAGFVHALVSASSDQIQSSPVGADAWHLSQTTIAAGAGPEPSGQVVLNGAIGWTVGNDRTVLGGARLAARVWTRWQPPCARTNGPAYLAAATATDLIGVCNEGLYGPPDPPAARMYRSTDGGATFHISPGTLPAMAATAVASPAPGVVVVAGGAGLLATFDGGRTWAVVLAMQSDSVSYIGFETGERGFAITYDGALLRTLDGGRLWNVDPLQT